MPDDNADIPGHVNRPSVWASPTMRRHVLVMGLGFTSFSLLLGSLPAWVESLGVSAGAAGLVTTVMLAATVATQGMIPMLVARFGLRSVLSGGFVMLGAPAPLYLLSHELWWVLGLSAVRGVGFAVLTVLGSTVTVRIAPAGRRGEAVGAYGLAVAIPNLVAIPSGVALTLAGEFEWVAALSALPLLAVPLLPRLVAAVPGTLPRVHADRGSLRDVMATAGPSTILLTVTLSGGGLVTFLPIERPDGFLASVALLAFGVAGAVARWRTGIVADRVGTRLLLPLAVVAAAVGMVMLGAGLAIGSGAAERAVVLAGAAVFGAGYGAVQNLTLVAAFARSSDDNVASAVWNISFDTGTAVGAFAVGWVAATGVGLPWTFVGCAVLIGLSSAPFLVRGLDGPPGVPHREGR